MIETLALTYILAGVLLLGFILVACLLWFFGGRDIQRAILDDWKR